MWGIRRATGSVALMTAALITAALVAAGCTALRVPAATPVDGVELMPGPASVWLVTEPAAPSVAVDVTMTVPADPAILFAHTFDAGDEVKAVFATSEGRYLLAARGGACALPLTLAADEEAQVRLAIREDGGCSLMVTWQGAVGAADAPPHGDGVLITNHDAGDATPRLESGG